MKFINVHPCENFVRAVYDYSADNDEELSIQEGDIITGKLKLRKLIDQKLESF